MIGIDAVSTGVGGANIADAVDMVNNVSAGAGYTVPSSQYPIGQTLAAAAAATPSYANMYVEAAETGVGKEKITANTPFIGMNAHTAYKTNVLAQGSVDPSAAPQPDFIVLANDNDLQGGTMQWVRAAGTIAENGTCTVTAGAATAGAGTYSCRVIGGVVVGDFFWAHVTAES